MSICRVVFVYESIPIMYCFSFPCSLAQEFVFHRFPLSEDAASVALPSTPIVWTGILEAGQWCRGGDRIVTWGDPDAGGDSSKDLKSPGLAEERATASGNKMCFCCNSGRWICSCLRLSSFWW